MRFLVGLVVVCGLVGTTTSVPPTIADAWAQVTSSGQTPPTGEPKAAVSETHAALTSATRGLSDLVKDYPRPAVWGAAIAVVILIGGGLLLYRTIRGGEDPMILRLNASFFFWLGMIYTALLLLMAGVYNLCYGDAETKLFGGILPIAVPWFGALGAVTISMEGVFLWNSQWDRKFNYWHIGRPLFGAVLGIVAFFLFIVIVSASGSTPKFLEEGSAPVKDFIIFYIVAFLVGYREETFRELIKRATDLIMKPGTPPPAAPAVTFRVAGTAPTQIQCPDVAALATSRVTVEVHNTGTAALTAPVVTLPPVTPTPANTFALANDQVAGGGDLAPGQARTVDVTFTPPATGLFAATLTVTAANLSTPATIRVVGRGQ